MGRQLISQSRSGVYDVPRSPEVSEMRLCIAASLCNRGNVAKESQQVESFTQKNIKKFVGVVTRRSQLKHENKV